MSFSTEWNEPSGCWKGQSQLHYPASNKHRENGFALIAAVWMLLLIAALATALSLKVFKDEATASDYRDEVQSRLDLESAILTVVMQRYSEARDSDLLLLPTETDIEINGRTVSVELHDDTRRLDLGRAQLSAIGKMARDLGVEAADARQVTLNIARLRRLDQSLNYTDILPAGMTMTEQLCFVRLTSLDGGVLTLENDVGKVPPAGSTLRATARVDDKTMTLLLSSDGEIRARPPNLNGCERK